MVAYFVWRRNPRGPEPQLYYDKLVGSDAPGFKNGKTLAVHTIPEDMYAEIKEAAQGDTLRAIAALAERFPAPVIQESS